jgi:tetratricopeptide (TPR) repeat protein
MLATLNKIILIALIALMTIGLCILYGTGVIDRDTFIATVLGCLLFIILNVSQIKKELDGVIKKLMIDSEKLVERNQHKAAKANYLRILKARPNHYDALIAMGRLCDSLRDLEESERAFKKAIDLKPSEYSSHLLLGITYFHAGKMLDAKDAINRAMALNQDAPEIYYYLGHIHQIFKDNEEAIQSYRKYLQLKPDTRRKEEIEEKIKSLAR